MSKDDGLYKRGAIWWLRTDPVTGERRSTKCKTKPAAVAYRAERERLAADPHYEASHKATVGKWADELVSVKNASKADGTAQMYRIKIGHVIRIFGRDCRMVDVTPPNVDRFVAIRRGEGAVNNTIGKELTALVQMCKLAKRGGAFAGDITALRPVGFSIDYVPRTATLTPEQAPKLFGALPLHRAAAAALAVSVGARASEAQRISREHIDIENWIVHIPGTKTKKSNRVIPVVLPAHRALLRFAAESGALPVRWPGMSRDIPALAIRLGLPRVTPNDLRRSFATWGIEAGISREDTAKLLGHGSTKMVFQVYGRESAEAFGRKLSRDIGTEPSQSQRMGGYCSGGPSNEFGCFHAVAPERIELSRPSGPGILNPGDAGSGGPDIAILPVVYAATVVPGLSGYHRVRTDAAQSAMPVAASAADVRRAAATWGRGRFRRDAYGGSLEMFNGRPWSRALESGAASLARGAGR